MRPHRDWPPTEVSVETTRAANSFTGRFPGPIIRIHPSRDLANLKGSLEFHAVTLRSDTISAPRDWFPFASYLVTSKSWFSKMKALCSAIRAGGLLTQLLIEF